MKIICNTPPKLIKSDTRPPCIKHTVWFDKQTKKLYYCDGKEWVEVSVCDFKVKQFFKPEVQGASLDLLKPLCAFVCPDYFDTVYLEPTLQEVDRICDVIPVYQVDANTTIKVSTDQVDSYGTLRPFLVVANNPFLVGFSEYFEESDIRTSLLMDAVQYIKTYAPTKLVAIAFKARNTAECDAYAKFLASSLIVPYLTQKVEASGSYYVPSNILVIT